MSGGKGNSARPARPSSSGRSSEPRRTGSDRPVSGARRRIDERDAPRGRAVPRRADEERSDRPRTSGRTGAKAPRRDERDFSRTDSAQGSRSRRPVGEAGRTRGVGRDDAGSKRRSDGVSRPPRRDGESTRSYSDRRGPARAPRRELSPEEIEKYEATAYGRERGWGSVARKGGAHIKSTGQEMASTRQSSPTPDPLAEWVEEVRPDSGPRPAKSKVKAKAPYALPGDIAADVRKAFIGTAYMREKMVATLTKAAEGYDRKRWEEALRLGRVVSDAVPGVAAVRELTGLAAYRAERWNMAKIHLRAHFDITGDPEHLPLVMDCDRAHRRFRAVDKTMEEITESDASADTLAEARIVQASAWADQKKFSEAIDLLVRAGGTKVLRNPNYRHVRLWYALADIFDRSGDQVSARELFARVVLADPEAYDARSRLEELGATSVVRKNRKKRAAPVSKKKI